MTTVVVPETGFLGSRERIVVSPAHGRVSIKVVHSYMSEGEVVREGQVLAHIEGDGRQVEIFAPCDAWVMAYLLRDGERVEPGAAIAHLRAL